MDRRNEIIDTITRISGSYSPYEVFSDWVKIMSLAISNSLYLIKDKVWQDREQMYADTIRRYNDSQRQLLHDMFEMLQDTLEDNPDDVLGDVFMKCNMGSSITGQFFTPFHVSYLTARMGFDNNRYKDSDEKVILNEPSCGGGGLVIATAKVMKEEGINYQKQMRVYAQDLDWKSVYMCYVQLSLLGIWAVCIQGDSLSDSIKSQDRSHRLITPTAMGVIL